MRMGKIAGLAVWNLWWGTKIFHQTFLDCQELTSSHCYLINLKLFVIKFWKEEIFNDRRNNTGWNKLRTYRLFKYNFSFESYLLYLSEKKRKELTKFRISSHKLEIEQGRYHKLPITNRICGLCKTEVGGANHFLLQRATLNKTRSNFIKDIRDKFSKLQ